MPTKRINFTKMHGTGNDYVYINCFEQEIENPQELARIMSVRRFSVGSDGLILICPSPVADAKMRMFNLDGSEGSMCGNGIRCVGKYIYDNGIAKKDTVTVETLSGIKTLKVTEKNGLAEFLTVDMGIPDFSAKNIPAIFPKDEIINERVSVNGEEYIMTALSMGNPHSVIFTDNPYDIPLEKTGTFFENNPIFPQKVNTEFIKFVNKNLLEMRVYERGSGETFSCGTGACAAVAAAVKNGLCNKNEEVTVVLKGGELYITYADDLHIYMRGSANKIYDGVYEYEY